MYIFEWVKDKLTVDLDTRKTFFKQIKLFRQSQKPKNTNRKMNIRYRKPERSEKLNLFTLLKLPSNYSCRFCSQKS